jgi:hypothetical protein
MTTSTRMKRLRGLLLSSTVALALLGAAPSGRAHADTSQAAFVHQVQSMGDQGTSDDILNNGYVMCNTLRTTNEDVHTVAVNAAPHIGVWVGLAAGEVGAAIRWLCPDQIWQLGRSQG